MKIYKQSGTEILDITPDDSSSRSRTIMGDDTATLSFAVPVPVEIPVGSYCTIGGIRYTLRMAEDIRIVHTRDYEYTLHLQAPQYALRMYMFKNPIDHRVAFDLTARPHEHMDMLITNLNEREGQDVWSLGDCIDDVERLVTYDLTNCWDAIKSIADTFNTEFEIVGNVVHLHMVEYHKATPLSVSYGKGNGLKSGITRTNETNRPPTDRLYVQGGERNIDRGEYGSSTLHLPQSVTLSYDGDHFQDEAGYVAANARTYITDSNGMYVERYLPTDTRTTHTEASFDGTDFYPSRIGKVTSVDVVDEDNNWYDIIDSTIPSGLDYNDYIIPGEEMKIIFQSGMLAGREFSINRYSHGGGDTKAGKRFEITPHEEDGIMMPNATFAPAINDTYIIVGCTLPSSYISDYDTRSGAEWDMLRAAICQLYIDEEPQVTFSGEIDPIWALSNWSSVSPYMAVGNYLAFSDTGLGVSAFPLRITAIKDNINRPHIIDITLSNAPVKADFKDRIRNIRAGVYELQESGTRYQKETQRGRMRIGVELANGINGTDGINGSMSIRFRDAATRFRFVTAVGGSTPTEPDITIDTDSDTLTLPSCVVQHQSIGLTVPSLGTSGQTRYFSVQSASVELLARGTHYIYIRVPASGSTGTWVVSPSKIGYTSEAGYLHLYAALVTPAVNGIRTLSMCYGWDDDMNTTLSLLSVMNGTIQTLRLALARLDPYKYVITGDEDTLSDGYIEISEEEHGKGDFPRVVITDSLGETLADHTLQYIEGGIKIVFDSEKTEEYIGAVVNVMI